MLVILHLALQIHFPPFSTLPLDGQFNGLLFTVLPLRSPGKAGEGGSRVGSGIYFFSLLPVGSPFAGWILQPKIKIPLTSPQQETVSFLVLGASSSLVIFVAGRLVDYFFWSLYIQHIPLSIVSLLNPSQIILIECAIWFLLWPWLLELTSLICS